MSNYQVPEKTGATFDFDFEGKTYSVPVLGELPMAAIREMVAAIDAAGEDGAERASIDAAFAIFDEAVPGVLDRMTQHQAIGLVGAYMQSSRPGESSPSSD